MTGGSFRNKIDKSLEGVSFLLLLYLICVWTFLPLVSKWLWFQRTEHWFFIDPGSPLRANVISALCRSCRGRWRKISRKAGGRTYLHTMQGVNNEVLCTAPYTEMQKSITFSCSWRLNRVKALLTACRDNRPLFKFQPLSPKWSTHSVMAERFVAQLWAECTMSCLKSG